MISFLSGVEFANISLFLCLFFLILGTKTKIQHIIRYTLKDEWHKSITINHSLRLEYCVCAHKIHPHHQVSLKSSKHAEDKDHMDDCFKHFERSTSACLGLTQSWLWTCIIGLVVVVVWEVATGSSSPDSHRCSTVCVLTLCNLFALICFAVPREFRF